MRWAALLVLLLLSGCCKPRVEVQYVPQRVEVPVLVEQPEPPIFERLPLPIDGIPDEAAPQDVIRLLIATLVQLQGEVKVRDEALSAYRRPKPPGSVPPATP